MSGLARGLVLTATVTLAASCRPDPGIPDYSSHVGVRQTEDDVEFLPGPNPYEPGTPRLYVGIFYEGEASDEILINDVDTHYYIFEQSYEQGTSSDRVEGVYSDVLTLSGTPFWGGGIIWDSPRNLSDWTTMYVSLKSSGESFADVPLIVQYETGGSSRDTTVSASSYGYINDGEWHSLRIPLADFAGFDPTFTLSPLIVSAPGGAAGDALLIDDLYFTQERAQ